MFIGDWSLPSAPLPGSVNMPLFAGVTDYSPVGGCGVELIYYWYSWAGSEFQRRPTRVFRWPTLIVVWNAAATVCVRVWNSVVILRCDVIIEECCWIRSDGYRCGCVDATLWGNVLPFSIHVLVYHDALQESALHFSDPWVWISSYQTTEHCTLCFKIL